MSGKKIANWTVGKIIVVVVALQAAPAQAIGACDAQQQLPPRRVAGHQRPPFALGDSVMLGAARSLAHAGFRVDARGCRQMGAGLDILRRRAARHALPHVVVVALGTNWTVTRADVRRALRIVGDRRWLVLVTPRPVADRADARVMRRAARRHPRRICVADWAKRSAAHPEWAPGDGIHLSAAGIRAFVALLRPYRRVTARHPEPCGRPLRQLRWTPRPR